MVKRRQKGPREDEVIDLTGPSCNHIRKGVDSSFLKKTGIDSACNSCQDCRGEEPAAAVQAPSEEMSETPTIWMCLKCGHRGCGRTSEDQHAIKHYEKPRSDPHCLVLSLDNWSVWCYICDDDVQYSKTGHLAQLVNNIKKQALSEPRKQSPQRKHSIVKLEDSMIEEPQETKPEEKEENTVTQPKENQKKNGKKENGLKESSSLTRGQKAVGGASSGAVGGVSSCPLSVRGLSNLGNTCFFNSVVQTLSQTQMLRQVINKVTAEEKTSVTITPGVSSDLEPILVQLGPPGSLTVAMCQILNEIQETKKGVVTPRELFSQVCKKAARFKGFQQQDSQELLRYLLDGMRAEEMKRLNSGISEALKKHGRDAEQSKKLVKEYEKKGAPNNFVDQVFGGEMTSTVMCQQCKTVSLVKEMFLDLSLPVSDQAYRKKSQKKGAGIQKASSEVKYNNGDSPSPVSLTNGDSDDLPTGSKYQQKKQKKQAKKQAKNQRRQQKLVPLDSFTPPENTAESPVPAEQGEETGNSTQGEEEEEPLVESQSSETERSETAPSEQDQEKLQGAGHTEKEEEDCEPVAVSNNHSTVTSEEQSHQSPEGVGKRDGHEAEHRGEEEEENDDGDAAQPSGDEQDTKLSDKLGELSLNEAFLASEDSDLEPGCRDGDTSAEMETETKLEGKEYTVSHQDPKLAFHTLATRAAPGNQECSVESCLYQFTEVENLTQNNSLLCVTCTKRQTKNKAAEGSKKNVYTDALKQMLISSPPPVLTLHLKRFQQIGYSVCKVNSHVNFPHILDVAPFCSVICKGVSEGGSQVLYSLYGIVEHSGTMRSGHYTAYVKARPFYPSTTHNGVGTHGEPAPVKGAWFHVSDSSVQPVTESKVQSSQAYLLFYERIS
ncbi:ubiquitin carboxyl-terminal hydrolase 16 [Oncorhynchus kisutch]|uniref:Ubiquitin carboxyl-terminal hydrolase n=1 Tax=Oncorhynchus kisutch TaxID=8019 RepID=A0A8C7GR51_ONCKI|nr:ubiquitin carboxyl-terminal hydrolase 16 [Oncorhynchus kisutch]XP_031647133.1 ubiquitin carboxyl-terminal hydrolase 16 [Oncorhynchus kisutch]XP_031647134.1 ubiquitin carboxyl-terminal hydrolase 16 [Oncorhynchus kisutch]XP_031647135.1 ubiquitin carboxyl-terminal hydrolase 16 [Oncorhynchus kisutch]XP_031647136.1 ubiquitin carboxyl-terminal hydrolase 16 [Oncorhynchus kisutch]